MSQLFMVELRPDPRRLMRFLYGQRLGSGNDGDFGYGIHAWLRAAFADLAPQPWRLLDGRGMPGRILAYSRHDAEALRLQLQGFADPLTFEACPPQAIAGKPLPAWRAGQRLGFEVLCCPVGRKSATGIEKDLFLVHADSGGEIQRDQVYCDWARARLERDGAAEVTELRLEGFRLVRQLRKSHGQRRKKSALLRPQALIRGSLTVADPDAFTGLLARGVGRHRAFGYGMVLVKPPA
ncbi:CRISPR system Cascade subunit CasE [Methylomarinovum caldicuralii]|uniref:CRISPR system Cascade subunit CasE n=1 Tax=Methylomarinovum caldicuralii TaxID=438856 RepID=A0AAU9CX71_9GAMM|nr:type I-E CRISPR-associated protein Cas6/Cse3/CasE [Methylomarinovum caldicuralii]BCX82597.1 CRISPR system Cascade subunit CasE [Methylomarinovum caldicuralii]